MKRIGIVVLLISVFVVSLQGTAARASDESLTRGAASLLVPGLGQYINGELSTQSGKLKTGTMLALEVGAIITTAVVGGVVGYPQVWAGLGIFIFNHVWSAADAYRNASAGPEVSLKEKSVTER